MPKKCYAPEGIFNICERSSLTLAKGWQYSMPAGSLRSPSVRPMEKRIWGLRVDQGKRLKGPERDNLRLKRIVAEQALDLSLLKEVASGNF